MRGRHLNLWHVAVQLHDPIPPSLLQTIAPTITLAITHRINSSFFAGTFPSTFKVPQVTSLLRKPSLSPAVISWMILQSQTRSQTASPTCLHGSPTYPCFELLVVPAKKASITTLTLTSAPYLLLFQGCLKSWSHDWWWSDFLWSHSLSLPVLPLYVI